MSAHQFRLSSHGYAGTVHLDGQDISRAVRDVTVKMRAGDVPQVTLGLAVHTLDESDIDAEVRISEDTRTLLSRLGWTPPGDNPRPAVHIENYAAGSPEDLAAQKAAQAGSALTSPHDGVEPADTDQLLVVLFNGRYYFHGDENLGVGLYCRDHPDGGRPLGYYEGLGRYGDSTVPSVTTMPALLDIAARHEAEAHRDH